MIFYRLCFITVSFISLLFWVSCNGKDRPTASPDLNPLNLNPLNITRRSIGFDRHPAWSSDGKRIAYTSVGRQRNVEIFVMNADGSKEINLTNHPSEDYDPTWSPDGQRIAFTSERDGNGEIYVMNVNGSNLINLTNSQVDEQDPAWSPDGTKIAMIVTMPELRQSRILFVMNADGTHRKQLFEFPYYVNSSESPGKPGTMSNPAWSPDGKQIAFGWKGDIHVVNPDGTELVRFGDTRASNRMPNWSPQGTHMVYATENADRTSVDLMVMDANGNNKRLLLDYTQNTGYPAWSPDGTQIAFSAGADIYLFRIDPALTATEGGESRVDSPPDEVEVGIIEPIRPQGEILTVDLPEGVTMEFVWIEPGKFMMGSPPLESGRESIESPQREVTISRGFYLGTKEITQRQWESVMGNNPSFFKGPNRPVEMTSWYDVQLFIQTLNETAGDSLYRLPREAEWEYACRAGTRERWSFGNDESQLTNYAWYSGNNSSYGTKDVGSKLPNPWGLFDMHGNMYEWCQDWYGSWSYSSDVRIDPTGPATGSHRVARGGAFYDNVQWLRSAYRDSGWPDSPDSNPGARLLRRK